MSVALQLYTVRHQLAEDFIGTLRRVREIGYEAVETYPFPANISASTAGGILESLGLRVVSMHTDLPLGERLSSIVEEARQLNCSKLIWHGWPRSPEYDSLEGIKRLTVRYNEAHAAARDHNLDLGLHNHWWEFEPVAGVYPYKVFSQMLAPEIFLEIDTYWVQSAGLDPASIIAELEVNGPRVQFLHLKDGPAVQGQPMTALGDGVMDFPAIFKKLTHRTQFVVELDECGTDIFKAIERSLRYLQSLRAAV
jgi:sugar phosphate isomerase/epimerase